MPTTALGKFIASEMSKRSMTEREFADFVGVASSTINGHVSEATSRHHEPSLRFLKRLSQATGISMKLALSLAYPELGKELEAGIDPRVLALAEKLAMLPDSTVQLILALASTVKDEGATNE